MVKYHKSVSRVADRPSGRPQRRAATCLRVRLFRMARLPGGTAYPPLSGPSHPNGGCAAGKVLCLEPRQMSTAGALAVSADYFGIYALRGCMVASRLFLYYVGYVRINIEHRAISLRSQTNCAYF